MNSAVASPAAIVVPTDTLTTVATVADNTSAATTVSQVAARDATQKDQAVTAAARRLARQNTRERASSASDNPTPTVVPNHHHNHHHISQFYRWALAFVCAVCTCLRFNAISTLYLLAFFALVQGQRPSLWRKTARFLSYLGVVVALGCWLTFQVVLVTQSNGYASSEWIASAAVAERTPLNNTSSNLRGALRQLNLNALDGSDAITIARLVIPDALIFVLLAVTAAARTCKRWWRRQSSYCCVQQNAGADGTEDRQGCDNSVDTISLQRRRRQSRPRQLCLARRHRVNPPRQSRRRSAFSPAS